MRKDYYSEVDLEVLKHYFQNTCSKAEESLVKEWFRNPSYEKALLYKIKEHWMDFEVPSSGELNSEELLQKIHHKILLGDWENSLHLPLYKRLYHSYKKIAAVILFPLLLLGGGYLLSGGNTGQVGNTLASYAEIHSPPAARTHFELPDGSSGWLNSGSKLKFPTSFSGTERQVTLSGEGYFDVSHDPEHPFVITAGKAEVHALGTSFNVKAWPEEDKITVTMESGLTVFYGREKNQVETKVAELRKGQQLIYYQKDRQFSKQTVNTESYTSWREGKLIFRNEPMAEVLKKLGRWYNVEFIVDNMEIDEYRYRATFKGETLDEVLKLLEHTSPIGYKELERVVLPDGTYSRKRIRLYINSN